MSTKIRSKILPDMNGSAATALKINIKPLQKLRKCVLFQGFIPPIVNSSLIQLPRLIQRGRGC